jgi:hypothetical protein
LGFQRLFVRLFRHALNDAIARGLQHSFGGRASAELIQPVGPKYGFTFSREAFYHGRMHSRLASLYSRLAIVLLAVGCAGMARADESSKIKCPSPDGRFALRIVNGEKAELIEQSSGRVLTDLGELYPRYAEHPEETILVWSADSKWVAYATRAEKMGETSVYFWSGSDFDSIDLPDDLPGPDIKIPKKAGNVKNYGGATKPVRWLKNGDLELSSDGMMLGRDDAASYTGVVIITLAFDAKHHASVKKVGKTKTTVEK